MKRSSLDPTPELKRLPPMRRGDKGGPEAGDLATIEKRLSSKELGFLADLMRRFEAITNDD